MCACQKSYTLIIMTSITWAGPRCVQEAAAILGSQNRTQGRCELQLQIGIPSSSSIGNINISDLPACDLASAQHVKVIRKNVDARCSIKLFIYTFSVRSLCVNFNLLENGSLIFS